MNKLTEQEIPNEMIDKLSEKISLSLYYSTINLTFCKQVMFAQLRGNIVLPHGLGLNQHDYQHLRKAINKKDIIYKELEWYKEECAFIRERAEFCAEMFAMKEDERQELISLLCHYRNIANPSSEQVAIIIATACLSQFHLWKSLGLPDREQLNNLIQHNFPTLHALNTDNMRWKRFFYRQLCEQGGDYICKAPSCGECKSYRECFA